MATCLKELGENYCLNKTIKLKLITVFNLDQDTSETLQFSLNSPSLLSYKHSLRYQELRNYLNPIICDNPIICTAKQAKNYSASQSTITIVSTTTTTTTGYNNNNNSSCSNSSSNNSKNNSSSSSNSNDDDDNNNTITTTTINKKKNENKNILWHRKEKLRNFNFTFIRSYGPLCALSPADFILYTYYYHNNKYYCYYYYYFKQYIRMHVKLS